MCQWGMIFMLVFILCVIMWKQVKKKTFIPKCFNKMTIYIFQSTLNFLGYWRSDLKKVIAMCFYNFRLSTEVCDLRLRVYFIFLF